MFLGVLEGVFRVMLSVSTVLVSVSRVIGRISGKHVQKLIKKYIE